jgi:hypothetical protein
MAIENQLIPGPPCSAISNGGLQAPKLAVADGALGFWAALRQVYPKTEEQRCWVHKIANVLDKLPKRLQPRAKSHLHEIMRAPDKATALVEMARFQEEYQAKYPKAVDCLLKDQETLFTFMDYPAAHWIHLRTTNAIESTFATVKARTRTTKGAGSRNAGLAMAFKLLTMAEKRWRKVNSAHLVPLVQAGVKVSRWPNPHLAGLCHLILLLTYRWTPLWNWRSTTFDNISDQTGLYRQIHGNAILHHFETGEHRQ